MNLEEPLKQLSSDLLYLLANGQAFSDVTFVVEGRHVYAHRCVLAARSQTFRMLFCNAEAAAAHQPLMIPLTVVRYDVFMLMLQFLYSGQLSLVPPHPTGCKEAACWHVYCKSAVEFALEALQAAQVFGIESLSILVQKELALIAEKASIEDVMKVLAAARKQDLLHLWSVSSKLVAKSGLSTEVLKKHLPVEVVAEIEAIRQKCGYGLEQSNCSDSLDDQRSRRMHKALDSSDVELVRLMVMGEGLDLDKALAIHYAVANCSRKVVKNLLELGAANVNMPGPDGRTPLHIAAEMADPEMIAVLLDHHADAHLRTPGNLTALNILQNLASEAIAVGAITGVTAEHNKLRLCLDLLESAAAVQRDDEDNSLLPDQQSQDPKQIQGITVGSAGSDSSNMALQSFYHPGPGNSPAWSEHEEVIDPKPRAVPSTYSHIGGRQ